MEQPLVTVLMTTYNGEKHIKEAIESIVRQVYKNWEFIIVVEYGTIDSTIDIIKSFNEKRIRVIQNTVKLGISSSLNVGLRAAKGKYIARIDDDDISLKRRLIEQVKVMEKKPKLMLCGSNAFIIDGNNNYQKIVREPFKNQTIKTNMHVCNCFISSAVMFRREPVQKNWCYFGNVSEDYLLWLKITRKHQVCNINKELVCYREYEGNRTKEFIKKQESRDYQIQKKLWKIEGLDYTINNYFFSEFKGRKQLEAREKMLQQLFNKKGYGFCMDKNKISLLLKLYLTAGMQQEEGLKRVIKHYGESKTRNKLCLLISIMSHLLEQRLYFIWDWIKTYMDKEYHV